MEALVNYNTTFGTSYAFMPPSPLPISYFPSYQTNIKNDPTGSKHANHYCLYNKETSVGVHNVILKDLQLVTIFSPDFDYILIFFLKKNKQVLQIACF